METNTITPPQPALRHSPLGITACIVGLLSPCISVGYFVFFVAAVRSLFDSVDGSMIDTLEVIWTTASCSTFILNLSTAVLALIALFQKNRKKLFAILALVECLIGVVLTVLAFNSIVILGQ